jgi:hypothetical protein
VDPKAIHEGMILNINRASIGWLEPDQVPEAGRKIIFRKMRRRRRGKDRYLAGNIFLTIAFSCGAKQGEILKKTKGEGGSLGENNSQVKRASAVSFSL